MPRTHCKHGHEFTPANTYIKPAEPGSRYCRECSRIAQQRLRDQRKAARMSSESRVFVFPVTHSTADLTGLEPGTYCVWVWGDGKAELMIKPLGARTFRPAAQGQEERS